MRINIKFVHVLALLLLADAGAWARSERYVVKVDWKNRMVRLMDVSKKRVLWSHRADVGTQFRGTWSRDHRSLAIDTISLNRGSWELLIWREGRPLRILSLPGHPLGYNMGTHWSPDGQSLILRPGDSAASDMGPNGAGTIWLVKTGRRGLSKPVPLANSVWDVRWRDSRTVVYKVLGESGQLLEKTHIRKVSQ